MHTYVYRCVYVSKTHEFCLICVPVEVNVACSRLYSRDLAWAGIFIRTGIDSQETQHLSLGLVGMHLAALSIWVVTKFFIFGVYLSDVS